MKLVRNEPVMVVGTLVPILVTMFCTYILHLSPTGVAAAVTIATGLTAIASAFLVKPVNLAVIGGACSTILVAAASFGLHLTSAEIAQWSAAIVAVLGYLLREKVSPAAP